MRKFTRDEIAILFGICMSAGVTGIGMYQLYVARIALSLPEYIWFMVTGAMLFNAGICGVTALAAIWYNYQAIL